MVFPQGLSVFLAVSTVLFPTSPLKSRQRMSVVFESRRHMGAGRRRLSEGWLAGSAAAFLASQLGKAAYVVLGST